MPESGGPGGPLVPPIFGRSVNPIPTGEGRLYPLITTGTPNVFHLPASLYYIFREQKFKKKNLLQKIFQPIVARKLSLKSAATFEAL